MKCPICGDPLTPSKKNPDFVLCHSCRKKFRLPKQSTPSEAQTSRTPADEEPADKTQVYSRREVQSALRKSKREQKVSDDTDFHLRYANIPPKSVREKQEQEMRRAYDELLSIGKEEKESKKRGFFRRRK